MCADIFTFGTIPGQRSSAQVQRRLLSGRNSSSSIPRIFTQCANSRLHTLLARAFMRVRRGVELSGIWTQQLNCSAILWRLYDTAVKIPKPSPRSVCRPPTCVRNQASCPMGNLGEVWHCIFPLFIVYFYTSGWSPPICFTFLSVLFMEHKYCMTISKIKGANFRLEAWNSTKCKYSLSGGSPGYLFSRAKELETGYAWAAA